MHKVRRGERERQRGGGRKEGEKEIIKKLRKKKKKKGVLNDINTILPFCKLGGKKSPNINQ